MAAACEISNVFSSYFSAMYSPDAPVPAPAPPAPAGDLAVPLSPLLPPEGPEEASWSREQPQFWSKTQVLEWLSFQVEQHQADASAIDLSRCDMDGAALCNCSPEELRRAFGPLGDQLYAQLWHQTSSFPDELSWIMDLLEQDGPAFPDPLGDPGPFDQGSPFGLETREDGRQPSPCLSGGYGAGALSPGGSDSSAGSTAGTGASGCSHSSDSGGSDMDLDARDSKLCRRADLPDYRKGDPKHGKRKRGRPRKLGREPRAGPDGAEGHKSKHAPRGTHLWEFIRDLLLHPERHEGLMRWEDRRAGVFRFLRSEAVAQLWGQKKKNSSMTYEKLSRAMRYYYKREILERVDGRRLVYKFGKNSSGWKEEEEEEEAAGSRH